MTLAQNNGQVSTGEHEPLPTPPDELDDNGPADWTGEMEAWNTGAEGVWALDEYGDPLEDGHPEDLEPEADPVISREEARRAKAAQEMALVAELDFTDATQDPPELAYLPTDAQRADIDRSPVNSRTDEDETRDQLGLADRSNLSKRQARLLASVLDSTELDKIPLPEPLLGGVLNKREFTFLSGKFGTYKSMIAVAWCHALATGQEWCGHAAVDGPTPVLYLAAEGAPGIRQRIAALDNLHGVKAARGLLTVISRPLKITEAEDLAVLRLLLHETGSKLLVLDTWHRITPGGEENSASEQAIPVDAVTALRDDFGVTVLAIHHTGHGQAHARGSSSLEDDADSSWLIKLGSGSEDAEDRSIRNPRNLHHRKAKDSDTLEPQLLGLMVDEEAKTACVQIIYPGGPGSPEETRYRELDEGLTAASIPASASRDTCQSWAKSLGLTFVKAGDYPALKTFRIAAEKARAYDAKVASWDAGTP